MYWPNETYGSSPPRLLCSTLHVLPLAVCLAGFRPTSASPTGRGLSLEPVAADRPPNLRTPSAAPNWFIFEFGYARGSGSEA